ncbi:MAG TPA: translocation/assembly module TamB, partial [Anaeromyxobacter sp.]
MAATAALWAMRALRAAGWALLGAFTLAGLALSLVALLAELPATRPLVARAVIGAASARIAGRLELEGIAVLPQGGLELHRLRVFDPDGHLVLAVGRARISADATALRSRRVGVAIELDHPSVLLEEERDGGVSIGRAFEPRRSQVEGPPGRAGPAGGAPSGAGFTVQITRLELRAGDVWWVDRDGNTRLEASGIDVVARGTLSAARLRAELRLRGELAAPIQTPVALEVVAALTGSALRVPLLKVDAADSAVSLAGEVDFARRAGRVLVERLGISRARALALFPAAP